MNAMDDEFTGKKEKILRCLLLGETPLTTTAIVIVTACCGSFSGSSLEPIIIIL